MSFSHPYALLLLLFVPALVALWIWQDGRRQADAARFANLSLVPNLIHKKPGRIRYLPLGVLLLALTALLVGFARPHATIKVPRKEATIVIALDVSRSMSAQDV